jgi:LmbE family N-acetylglucosaminyl deacetylase
MTSSEQDGPAGRILVVEDDLVTARFVTQILRGHGFDVTQAADPVVALKLAATQPWDLVLTDVEMPGMTGLELLGALRRVAPDLAVIVMTAHASLDYAMGALRNSADEFLQKPVKPDHLLATVSVLVAKGRAARLASRQSVLAIGAHPDDVEIGAGGALLAHRAMGHEVSILTLSRGARGGMEAARAGESEMAARVLGATLYLDDLQDTSISESDPTISVISRVVESVRPTAVYTHSFHDVHQDHRNTYRAAMVAVRDIGRVYCFQSPSATVEFRPTRFVNIDEHLERKLRAIGAFASQVEVRAYLEPDMIQSTARYWSRYGGGRYAEAFEVVRDSAERQPVSVPSGTRAARPGGEADAESPAATATAYADSAVGMPSVTPLCSRAASAGAGHRRRRPGRGRCHEIPSPRPDGGTHRRRYGSLGRWALPRAPGRPDADPGGPGPGLRRGDAGPMRGDGGEHRHPHGRCRTTPTERSPRGIRPGRDRPAARARARAGRDA